MAADGVKPDLSGTAAARNFGGGLRARTETRPDVPHGLSVGDRYAGKVASLVDFGVFVTIEGGFEGLMHRSAIDGVDPENREAGDLNELFVPGQLVEVEVLSVDRDRKRVGFKPV